MQLQRSILLSLVLLTLLTDRALGARGPIQDAIQSGAAADYNRDDCTWRRGSDKDSCPDPDVHVYLYGSVGRPRKKLDTKRQSDWLRQAEYEPRKENVILIHGYAGGDNSLPISVLRDAYVNNGSYNVFMIDWSALSDAPCYPAAVANLRPVGRCLADTFTALRNLGLPFERTTCVGHSLGAHLCGIVANYLLFRMHRIIGLDPARPLIRPGLINRLDSGDAEFVVVIHTNAGYYGEAGRIGHVDFCVNGGKIQPFCEDRPNYQLCSHVWVVCYMAQSIDGLSDMLSQPCPRRCPSGPRVAQRDGTSLIMGQHTPSNARGSYCLATRDPPYCPKYLGGRGDSRCCV